MGIPHACKGMVAHEHDTEEELDACQDEHDRESVRRHRELLAHYGEDD